jgi:hypothetical protein
MRSGWDEKCTHIHYSSLAVLLLLLLQIVIDFMALLVKMG